MEILRLTIWDVLPEADLPTGQELWKQFLGAGKLSGEITLRRKHGDTVEIEYRSVANILPGLHMAVCRDITERMRTEEMQRQL